MEIKKLKPTKERSIVLPALREAKAEGSWV
jgi:hypothetical protein